MAKVSERSRSFLRNRNDTVYTGDFEQLIAKYEITSKKDILEYMHRHNLNDRAVFFAENLKIKTREELEALKADLYNRLNAINADGIAELHLSGDGTSKDAHMHYWGVYNDLVKEVIEEWIKDNRLSNKISLEYTSEEFDEEILEYKNGKLYKVSFEEREGREKKEKILNEIASIEDFETEIAINNEKESKFFEIMQNVENILEELQSYYFKEEVGRVEIKEVEIKEVEIKDIDGYLKDLDEFINNEDDEYM
jgi:hypothetical protein